jgi:hypothetical protein
VIWEQFMNRAKIFIAFTFLLTFAVYVSAQTNQYPNEIEGYEFFKSEKLSALKLLASDKDNVKAIFGEKCEHGCDYDDDWKISFSYVNSGWSRKFTVNGEEQIYKPKPEFVGKLAGITFNPKRQILLHDSITIPRELNCSIGTSRGNNLVYKVRSCIDDRRLWYVISEETLENKEVIKGQMMTVIYITSEKDFDGIFALIEK